MPDAPLMLRPLGLTDLVDEVFVVYRRLWPTLLGIAAIGYAPGIGIDVLRALTGQEGDTSGVLEVVSFVASMACASIVFAAAMIPADASYRGATCGVGQAYRQTLARGWPLARLSVLGWGSLLALLVVVAMVAGVAIAVGAAGDWLIVPAVAWVGMVALATIAAFVFGVMVWSLAYPVLMLEQPAAGHRSARAALKRGLGLLHGAWWRSIVASGVLLLLTMVMYHIPMTIFWLMTGASPFDPLRGAGLPVWQELTRTLVAHLVGVVTAPITSVAIVLIYLDRRVRLEGYDLSVQARAMREGAAVQRA